jgi:hypothetical protein
MQRDRYREVACSLLCRIGLVRGFVTLRQTFVRRSQAAPQATVDQLQARVTELEEELAVGGEHKDLRVLLDRVLREVDDLPEELRSAIEEALR